MNIQKINTSGTLYQQALDLRYQLFFKPHDLPVSILFDDAENISTHIALSSQSDLIAYGRVAHLNSDEFQISQMVVAPSYQGQGYGSALLREAVEQAEQQGARRIVLNARTTATELYRKQGFQTVGEVYRSANTAVEHVRMEREI